mgnify:CR=1 FL=1
MILNIEQIKELSQPAIEIPGFQPGQVVQVKVQRPNIMGLLAHGKIPNHLLSTVNKMITGQPSKKEKEDEGSKAKEVAKLYELYCEICLVQPTYQEFKEYITDEQMEAIFSWATAEVKSLDSFRGDAKNGSDHNDGTELSKEA